MMPSGALLGMTVFLLVFAAICVVGFVVFIRLHGDQRRAVERLRGLAAPEATAPPAASLTELARDALPKLGRLILPPEKERHARQSQQMHYAGFYGANALRIFMGTKLVLMLVLPVVCVLGLCGSGLVSWSWALCYGVVASGAGMLAPNVWLNKKIKQRQRELRKGLPDALDMLILCLEGGISLPAAFQRVTGELMIVHPVLGVEMNIIQREIQLGSSPGDALKKMGQRCGLQDVRDLALVLQQSERFGASIVKAVRTYADGWRQERQNQAEELAQKAAVKILFPTLLCIFPSIFVVLLGPAAIQMATLFAK